MFAPEKEKGQIIQASLQRIIRDNIMVPRSDVMFYTMAAVEAKQKDTAKQFIQKAHEWYPTSRAVTAAEEALANPAN